MIRQGRAICVSVATLRLSSGNGLQSIGYISVQKGRRGNQLPIRRKLTTDLVAGLSAVAVSITGARAAERLGGRG